MKITAKGNRFSHSAFYLLANVSKQVSQAAWIPIAALVLSNEDFVRFGLLQAANILWLILGTICLGRASDRIIFDYKDLCSRIAYIAQVLLLMVGSMVLFTLLSLLLFGRSFAENSLVSGNRWMFLAIPLTAYMLGVMELVGSFLRSQGEVMRYFKFNVTFGFSQLLLSLIGVFLFEDKIFGISMGICAAALLAVILDRPLTKEWRVILDVRFTNLKNTFHYSIPIMFHSLGLWMVGMGGRWISDYLAGTSEKPGLAFLFLLMTGVMAVPTAVGNAWLVDLGKAGHSKDVAQIWKITGKLFKIALLAVILTCAAAVVFMGLITKLQPHLNILNASYLLAFFSFSILHVFYIKYQQVLWALKKGVELAIGTMLSGILAVLVMMLFGMTGTANGILLGVVCGMLIQVFFTRKQAIAATRSLNQ